MRLIHDIAQVLRPSLLDELDLVPALRWQGREVARRSGLAVAVDADDDCEFLPDTFRTCIDRIVQDALHNVVKHDTATSVAVSFQPTNETLLLTVEDNGKDLRPASDKGMGLRGIEERAGRLSGLVKVTPSPGKGTTIQVNQPLPAAEKRRGLMIRIALANIHTVLRAGLKSLLERQRDFEVVGEAGDGRDLLRVVGDTTPNVVVTDIGMPKLNGTETTSQIATKHPNTRVIVPSMHSDEASVLRALKAGVRSYSVKESAEADLMTAIRTVHSG